MALSTFFGNVFEIVNCNPDTDCPTHHSRIKTTSYSRMMSVVYSSNLSKLWLKDCNLIYIQLKTNIALYKISTRSYWMTFLEVMLGTVKTAFQKLVVFWSILTKLTVEYIECIRKLKCIFLNQKIQICLGFINSPTCHFCKNITIFTQRSVSLKGHSIQTLDFALFI